MKETQPLDLSWTLDHDDNMNELLTDIYMKQNPNVEIIKKYAKKLAEKKQQNTQIRTDKLYQLYFQQQQQNKPVDPSKLTLLKKRKNSLNK